MYECEKIESMEEIASRRGVWKFVNVVELNASPETVFSIFSDGEQWPKWFSGMRKVEWAVGREKTVGVTRQVSFSDFVLDEYFFAWEEGRRFSFRFDRCSKRFFSAGAEDYLLERIAGDDNKCLFTYTVYIVPSCIFCCCSCLAKPPFAKTFRQAAESLVAYINSDRNTSNAQVDNPVVVA